MLVELACTLLVFLGSILGFAWPVSARLALDPPEKFAANAALSLLGIFVFGWIVYVCGLPLLTLWGVPAIGVAGLLAGRKSLSPVLQHPGVRQLAISQLIVTAWCVGWLALVVSYSGGGWTGDWFVHWQRMQFFLEHQPLNILFNGFDAMPSRPPLANILTGVFVRDPGSPFAFYLLVSTLLGSVAFLPAALLARRFRHGAETAGAAKEGRTTAVLAIVFMLNPLFLQNATFAWTKLPAAFFILTALYFFLRAHDSPPSREAGVLFAVSLAAGILAHYSAGPYAVFLALAWIVLGRHRARESQWRTDTLAAAGAGALVLALWFGWALAVYGVAGTFLTNTSVTEQAPSLGAQLQVVLLNVRDTLVPHFLRTVDARFLAQSSPWGWWRDWFFQLYQVNFFFAFGSVAWIAIAALLVRTAPAAGSRSRWSWSVFVTGTIGLGVIVHGARDTWGLTHICLQPLILLGLAFLAAHWETLGRGWRLALVTGAVVDFLLGIALHFGAQSFLLDRWLRPDAPPAETMFSYSEFAAMNLHAKLQNACVFFSDFFAGHLTAVLVALAFLFLFAVVHARRRVDPQ